MPKTPACLFALPLLFVACSPSGDATPAPVTSEPAATATVTVPTAPPKPVRPRPSLPANPPPSAPELAHEVPKLEAELAANPDYVALWATAEKADRDLLLSFVSVIISESAIVGDTMIARGKAKPKIQDAAVKLFLIFVRTGTLPAPFLTAFGSYLDKMRDEPNRGTWSAGPPGHDFAALAAWVRREDPDYQRAVIAARAAKHLGYGWTPHKEPPDMPWLVEELPALERLSLLDKLTPAESARLAKLKEEASIVRTDADTILSEYKNNELRADGLYKGKLVQISGVIGDVKRDLLNQIYVTVGTGKMFEIPIVQCFFPESAAAKVTTLNKGMRVTVRGNVSGLMANVLVKNCSLVE